MDSGRIRLIRAAAFTALFGNFLLCVLKITVGLFTKSLAVFGDGLDSASDVILAVLSLAISFVIARPSNSKYPWGHHRAETLAAVGVSFIIFFAGLNVSIEAGKRLFYIFFGNAQALPLSSVVFWTALISMIGKLALAFILFRIGKKAESIITLATAKNMRNDIVLSVSILMGFLVSRFFYISFIDPLLAVCVGAWIMRSGVKSFLDLTIELMDGSTNRALYTIIFETAGEIDGIYHPHRVRIRKIANFWEINLDIEVEPSLTVYESHELAETLTDALKQKIAHIYDIIIHVEPLDSDRCHESFGLCETDLDVL